jgi:hypothetical protein
VNRIIGKQKSIQGRTSRGADMKPLSKEQDALAQKTGNLAKDVKSHDEAARGGSPESGSQDKPPSPDEERKEGSSNKKDGSEDKSGDQSDKSPGGENKKGNSSDSRQGSQGGQPGEGSDQKSPPSGDSPPSGSQSQPSPVQKNLEAAQRKMKEAKEKLDKAEREGAVEDQEEAIRQLEQAKSELEEILRQLREEELARMLTLLEARFKKMLDLQRAIYKTTKRLGDVPADKRSHEHEIEASRQSRKEAVVVLEADKALLLLHEDGTSIAFPEALSQTRDDMEQVVHRLGRARVGAITQEIEEDVIASLEEMLAALQKALEELEERQQQPTPPPPPGQGSGQALIDQLSELRMIRALQMRVNTRTKRYSKLIEGDQADNPDLLEALRRLSKYQEKIYRITRDLESGKNQ